MDKEELEIQMMDYLSGKMSEVQMKDFEGFLEDNPTYKSEMQELRNTWEMVNDQKAPEPSAKMDAAFFDMLSNEIEKEKKKSTRWSFFQDFWSLPKPQLVYGLVLLGVGIAVGHFMDMDGRVKPTEKVIVDNETESVRQKLVLTLLEQPSANQRLQGVSEANKFEAADEIVIKALLQTLNEDSNVNVRLAAIESLTNYVDSPIVRQGLVQSIPNQESPVLQLTLANLMVALQERASIEPFKKLLQERELDTTVQKKIKNSIESII